MRMELSAPRPIQLSAKCLVCATPDWEELGATVNHEHGILTLGLFSLGNFHGQVTSTLHSCLGR